MLLSLFNVARLRWGNASLLSPSFFRQLKATGSSDCREPERRREREEESASNETEEAWEAFFPIVLSSRSSSSSRSPMSPKTVVAQNRFFSDPVLVLFTGFFRALSCGKRLLS